jgi:hypothetical protein
MTGLVTLHVRRVDDLLVLGVRNRLPDVEQLIVQDESVHHG